MRLTPLRAIRAKCLDCSAGSYKEVRLCLDTNCPLWPYRLGRRPKTPSLAKTHGLGGEFFKPEGKGVSPMVKKINKN